MDATATAPRRSKGRPKAGEATVGRDEILRAAAALLKTTPVDKLTSAAVARSLGAHAALINYYFKSRSDLLLATAVEAIRQVRAQAGAPADPTAGLEQTLRRVLSGIIAFHQAHPYAHALIVGEVLHSSSPEARAVFDELVDNSLKGFGRIIDRGAASGELRAVDPLFLYIAAVGMCEFYSTAGPIVSRARGGSPPDGFADDYLDFMVDLVLRGLAPR